MLTADEVNDHVHVLQKKGAKRKDKERSAAVLYARYANSVKFHIEQKILHKSLAVDANDIAAVTMAKAFSKIKMFSKKKSQFSTWLFKIAQNTTIDHIRSMDESRFVQDADQCPERMENISFVLGRLFNGTVFEQGPYNYNGIRELEKQERVEMVHNMLTSIPNEKERIAVELFYLKQLSYKEIVKIMRVPMGSVKSYLFRGCKYLENNFSLS